MLKTLIPQSLYKIGRIRQTIGRIGKAKRRSGRLRWNCCGDTKTFRMRPAEEGMEKRKLGTGTAATRLDTRGAHE